jgi:hypothetical protein
MRAGRIRNESFMNLGDRDLNIPSVSELCQSDNWEK